MTLHQKLLAVQTALKAPKSNRNSFGNYNYRSCEDILEALKPLLKEHGLVLTLTDDIVLIGSRYYVKSAALLSDEVGGPVCTVFAFAREEETKKGMDSSQITGAASSYARKYALNGLFCIDDTKDSDATNTHDKEEPKNKPKTPPQPALASPDVVQHILELCKALDKDEKAMWEHYKVTDGKPTKEKADLIVTQLYAHKRKLDKELNTLAQS